jgi:hypothetical protein
MKTICPYLLFFVMLLGITVSCQKEDLFTEITEDVITRSSSEQPMPAPDLDRNVSGNASIEFQDPWNGNNFIDRGDGVLDGYATAKWSRDGSYYWYLNGPSNNPAAIPYVPFPDLVYYGEMTTIFCGFYVNSKIDYMMYAPWGGQVRTRVDLAISTLYRHIFNHDGFKVTDEYLLGLKYYPNGAFGSSPEYGILYGSLIHQGRSVAPL